MFLKTFGAVGALTLGGLYVTGVIGGGYSRTVDRPPEEVMRSVADLDIREVPGEPGTDPARAGGITPRFRLVEGENQMEWLVMSGGEVAMRMTATFEPVNDGAGTRVTAYVERGDVPDEYTSPAFRSEGTTLGLFGIALDTELDELLAPVWGPHCDELRDRLFGIDEAAAYASTGRDASFGDGIRAIGQVSRAQRELLAAGCNPDTQDQGGFREVTDTVRPAEPGGAAPSENEVNFEPGRPMVDISR